MNDSVDMKKINKIVVENDALVLHTLRNFSSHPDYHDILQEGRLGFLTAMRKFDFNSGNSFSTYAVPYIKGFALRYINKNNSVYIPVHIMEKINKITNYQKRNPNIDIEQVYKDLEISKETYDTINIGKNALNAASLDFLETEGFLTPIEEKKYDVILERYLCNDIRKFIKDKIDDKECLEIALQYFDKPKDIKNIASEHKISVNDVKKYVYKFIRILRHPKIIYKIRRKFNIPSNIKDTQIADYLFQ